MANEVRGGQGQVLEQWIKLEKENGYILANQKENTPITELSLLFPY